jgi:saccharopine dehydrogenase-like NADP-dependent oxidoreductase
VPDRILVVGGYGQVGRVVSNILAARYPETVVVAGRSYEKASAFAAQVETSLIPYRLNLDATDEVGAALVGVRLVISCVGRSDASLARKSLERGIGYIEVGASLDSLQRTLAYDEIAVHSNAAAIPCVGLVPGLSNLLAADLAKSLDGQVQQIDIFLMLGLQDEHGVDAVRWMLERANRDFEVPTPRGVTRVHALSDPVQVRLPNERRARTAYRFDFADQHVLPDTVGTAGASTRICFDSRLATRLLRIAHQLGLLRIANRFPPDLIARLVNRLSFGDDRYALIVIAYSRTGCALRSGVTGRQEARATGLVTALAAEALLEGHVPPGVHHIERVMMLDDVRERLERENIVFWHPEAYERPT